MSFDAGAITSTLSLDTSPFTHSILESQGLMELFPRWITDLMANPLLGLAEIIKEVGASLKEMILGVTEALHAEERLAESIGVSATWLDAWGKAARASGGNAEEVAEALHWLQRRMGEAATGTQEASAAFQRWHISIRDTSGHLRNVQDVISDVSDRLASLHDRSMQAAMAQDLLGRGAGKMLAFFAQGSAGIDDQIESLRRLGALASDEQFQMSSKFEGMLNSVRMAWEGIKMKLAEKIVPALMPMLEALLQWIEQNPDKIASIIQGMSNIITGAVEAIGTVLQWAGEHWQTFEAIVVGGGLVAGLKIAALAIGSASGMLTMFNMKLAIAVAGIYEFHSAWQGVSELLGGKTDHMWRTIGKVGGGIIGGVGAAWASGGNPWAIVAGASAGAEAGGWAMGHFDPTPKAVTVNNSFAITATEDRQARDAGRRTEKAVADQMRQLNAMQARNAVRQGI